MPPSMAANSSPHRNSHDAASASRAKACGSAIAPRLNRRSSGLWKSATAAVYIAAGHIAIRAALCLNAKQVSCSRPRAVMVVIFEQYYLECLSQASYLLADETSGRAVVVDPRRDIEQYLESARDHGASIELVIETHFHADFLSGHLELARATGAEIAFGSRAMPQFAARAVHDGERISLGDVTLQILETPGHTPESISIVVYEHPDDAVPYGVLTGDTLFIGDVGRPDLLSSLGATSHELATMLHDSLSRKLMALPDPTRVFPGHGAGSACGKNLSSALSSTIGEQRSTNYALQPMTRDQFVHVVTEGQPAAPAYFGYDAAPNRQPHE